MLFFRRVSKSKVGTVIMAFVLDCHPRGFALADLSNFGTGNLGLGMGSRPLPKAGSEDITDAT